MKRLNIFIALLLTIAFAAPAAALDGWGVTRWGMSKEELVSLMGDKVIEIKDNGKFVERILIESISIGATSLDVELILTDNVLSEVSLQVPGVPANPKSTYKTLKGLLIQKYGQPDTEGMSIPGGELLSYEAKWFEDATTITLLVMPRILALILYDQSQNLDEL